ncbi:uncharacterized protein LAESUDRAFT_687552 [Laetiporus sulphureus 93-53]|uniref:Protein NO VEIN C-terminal domain-containing protein n=1 Tax=Laetiporus sulphureus 93-53 TaxID=1314785 RepID=A0A165BDS6_9APHY|nr:uncharacterized protein LAESUDRAFT_687552 [Laetiporus sulphureus 93-53]KZT00825.1 hypothetical protein LAESUDRAFT_687552 [Laetiporus sulphureus 93-53]
MALHLYTRAPSTQLLGGMKGNVNGILLRLFRQRARTCVFNLRKGERTLWNLLSYQHSTAMDLIKSINRSHGLETMGDRPADDPIVTLRGKLERACDRLSRDLYNTKTHFLLEFIQNADDNNYDSGVIPTLQLQLERRRMTIRCNELGFGPANVKAICDIGGSTKTKDKIVQGYIGEKGIGFKAVFVVATKVHVASNLYTFRFDRDGPLGMINPIWDNSHAVEPNWTTFRLDIAEEEHMGNLNKQLRELQPSLLLFLRKLRSVDLHVAANRNNPARSIKISRNDPAPDVVELERSEDGASILKRRYIIVKRTTVTDPEEPKREGIERSEVVLAFPMTAEQEPLFEDQYIHAFLPMSRYGFTFVIQADFLTTSSRESILADSKWNQQLFVGISDAFVDAVQRFQEHPILKDVWIRFIPMQIKDPFCKVADRIITLLKHRNVLRASDGTLSQPVSLLIPPRQFRDDENEPLIPSQYLPKGLRYLSDSYDVHGDSAFFSTLGVRTMSDQDFLNGLKRMGTAIGSQSDRWQETVCRCLNGRIPKTRKGKFRPEILDLEILPLSDGSWAAAKTAHRHVFVANLDGFAELRLSSIKEGIEEGSFRHRFYAALGVKRAEPALIAEQILQIRSQVSAETLVRYARFFYEHRRLRDLPSPADLQVVDEQGLRASGKELYLDVPDSKGTERTPLRTILPRTARFLHPAYTETYHDRYWILWLQDSLGINVAPRLISGKLSPEFQTMARSMETLKFLLVLREYWPQLSRGISQEGKTQLSQTEVKCEDGRHLLGTTALKRSALQRMPSSYLHFLPISNANSGAWNFLAELGVMIEANLSTFIKLILQLQRTACNDLSLIVELYKQLNARFDEDSNAIRVAFQDNPLIYVPSVNTDGRGSWIAFRDAYWDGPPSMTSKVVLKHSYPLLEDFFHSKLCMRHAPLQVLVDEFKSLAVKWNNKILTEAVATNVEDKLLDITDCLVQDPYVASILSEIAELPIFPVCQPGKSSKRVLQRIHEFYVPDQAGKYAEQFEDKVPLLAVSPKLSVVSIQPLFNCHTWKQPARYLERCISAQTVAHGTRKVDMPVTQQYIRRLEYLERELYHKRSSRIPTDQMEFLRKMDNLTIEIVGSISSSLTLEEHVVQTNATSSIQEDDDRVSIFVAQASANNERKRDRQVCSRLAERLDLDGMRLQRLFETPVDELEELLDEQGVFAIPPEAERIRKTSWLTTDTMTNDQPLTSPRRVAKPEETDLQMEPPPTLAYVPPHARNPVKRKRDKLDDLEENIRDLRMKLSSSSKFTQGEVRTPGSSPRPVQTAREIARFMSAPVSPGKLASSPGKESSARAVTAVAPSTASDRVNGILGELYVYELLRELIGLDFDEENWTSELRGEVHDLAPFSGDALADFRYKDSSGILTGLWYGEKIRTAWAGMWPTYHLEVKATSGSARERFHVSQRQLDAAQHLTSLSDSSGIIPTDVYVIILVTGIRSASPSHMVFIDPHRCIYHGDLLIQSDVYLSL